MRSRPVADGRRFELVERWCLVGIRQAPLRPRLDGQPLSIGKGRARVGSAGACNLHPVGRSGPVHIRHQLRHIVLLDRFLVEAIGADFCDHLGPAEIDCPAAAQGRTTAHDDERFIAAYVAH